MTPVVGARPGAGMARLGAALSAAASRLSTSHPAVGVALGAAAGLVAGRALVGASERSALLACLGLAAVAGVLAPRRVAPLVIVWSLLAGALRKWMLGGVQDLLLFAALPLMAGAYAGVVIRRLEMGRPAIPGPIAPPLASMFAAWALVECLNPSIPDPRVAVLGAVVRLAYIPFAYLVAEWAASRATLFGGIRVLALLSVPLLVLGFFQSSAGHASDLNRFVWGGSSHKAAGGGAVRVTSTFAYIWGYTAFLHAEILLLLGVLAGRTPSRRWRLALSGILAAAYVNLLMTGTRGAVFFVTLSIAAFGAIVALGSGRGSRSWTSLRRVLASIAVATALVAFTPSGQAAAEAFWTRVVTSRDTTAGRLAETLSVLKYAQRAGLTGFGLGTTYQGARRLVPDPAVWQGIPTGFEEEPERMVIELGLVGYGLLYALRFAIAWRGWALYRTLRDPDLRPLALAVAIYMLPSALHLEVHADNLDRELYCWAMVGVLLALPRLDARAETGAPESSPPPDHPRAEAAR